jgi:hypothetical protein
VTEQVFDYQTVKTAILQLLNISTPEEALTLIQQRPELRTDQAVELLELLINQAQEQGKHNFINVLSGLKTLIQQIKLP